MVGGRAPVGAGSREYGTVVADIFQDLLQRP
jgi:hypothetical protein